MDDPSFLELAKPWDAGVGDDTDTLVSKVDVEARDDGWRDAEGGDEPRFVPDQYDLPCVISMVPPQDMPIVPAEGRALGKAVYRLAFPRDEYPRIVAGTRVKERPPANSGRPVTYYRAVRPPDDTGRAGLEWVVYAVQIAT